MLALQALAPDHARLGLDFHSLFKEAVNDSLANILDENEAKALVILIAGTDFESPQSVFAALDSILHEGSQILKGAIVEEFRTNVHLLSEKAKKGMSEGHAQYGSRERLQELDVPMLDRNKNLSHVEST